MPLSSAKTHNPKGKQKKKEAQRGGSSEYSYLTVYVAVVGLLTFTTFRKIFPPATTEKDNMLVDRSGEKLKSGTMCFIIRRCLLYFELLDGPELVYSVVMDDFSVLFMLFCKVQIKNHLI